MVGHFRPCALPDTTKDGLVPELSPHLVLLIVRAFISPVHEKTSLREAYRIASCVPNTSLVVVPVLGAPMAADLTYAMQG
jgi:hypothetical protein